MTSTSPCDHAAQARLGDMVDLLDTGRRAFGRQAWSDVHAALTSVSVEALDAASLERLAVACYLTGRDDDCAAAWEAAHQHHLDAGDPAEAARCSFWLAFSLMVRGQMAQAGGWLGRSEAIVREHELDCPAAGYLLIPACLGALEEGDPEAARDMAAQAAEMGSRFGEPDLRAFGMLGHGQALLALGDAAAGTARFDDVMVSVIAGEVGPITSGIVYCAVILECMQLFDLARASEWTDALSDWCEAQPDLVPYRGQCLVHRSQLQQASGSWPDALTTAEVARRRLAHPPHPALGLAHYQEAELHRLLGDLDEAEAHYRLANRSGHQPMPGLALLELARGDADSAAASIRRALQETTSSYERPGLLAAAVDIFRATGAIADARPAADELAEIADRSTSAALKAMADQATGTVLLGEGEPSSALNHLRAAASDWRRLGMPYEGARTTVLLGLSCAALGDRSSAALEFDSAQATFTELGARPDLDRLQVLSDGLGSSVGKADDDDDGDDGGSALSDREREVLTHVAAGRTNREIASELTISQHTVGRHLENIFVKLGVNSRAAATAYAYEHDLL